MNRIGIAISILMSLTSMCACKDRRSNREIIEDIYKDYTLVQYMREYSWMGTGDSGAIYSPDLAIYEGLGIKGKSFNEIKHLYGSPWNVRYDTLYHGISIKRGAPLIIYPLTYERDSVPILFSRWYLENDFSLTVYFETHGDSATAIYGYQLILENLCE